VRAMSIVRRLLVLGLGLAAAASVGDARADEPPPARAFPFPVQTKKLPNGLPIVVIPVPGSGLVSVRTVVRTGSRDEYEPGRTGFAHFFEHMMFRGTRRFPQEKREQVLTKIGAATNAYTDSDRTVYQYDVAAEDLELVLDLESDRFMNLEYSKGQFETEAGAVYGEYRKMRADPYFQVEEALVDKAFDKHTYKHTGIGYQKDIAAMPTMMAYSKTFFSRYYRPENTVVVIVGDVEPTAAMALAEKYWTPWKRGYKPPRVVAEPEQKGERKVDLVYEGKTLPIVALAYKNQAFAPTDVDYVSSLVLAELVFGGTSPLYKQLVLDERSVQDLSVFANMSRDPGLFSVYVTVADPARLDAVRAAIDAAIQRAKDEPADAARVAAVVSNLRYKFLLRLDTPESIAETLAPFIALTGSLDSVEQLQATLSKVTPETVRAAAQRVLDARRRTVATLREKTP
jgi:zinc protease